MKTLIIVFFTVSLCFCLFAVVFVILDAKRSSDAAKQKKETPMSAPSDSSGSTAKAKANPAEEKIASVEPNMAATFFYTMPEKAGAQPMPVGYFVYGKADKANPQISAPAETAPPNKIDK